MRGRMVAIVDTGLNVVHVRDVARATCWRPSAGAGRAVHPRPRAGNLSLAGSSAGCCRDHGARARRGLRVPYALAWCARACSEGARAPHRARRLPCRSRRCGWRASACTSARPRRCASSAAADRPAPGACATPWSGSRPTATRASRTGPPARLGASLSRRALLASRARAARTSTTRSWPCRAPRREALYAVYAFCRTVDDIADLGHDPAAQRAGLARVAEGRRALLRAGTGPRAPHRAPARRGACRPIAIPRAALEAIVEGCEMDLRARHLRDAPRTSIPYCYRVASAVGLCCIEIFGYTDPARARLRGEPRHRAAADQHHPRRRRRRAGRPRVPAAAGPARRSASPWTTCARPLRRAASCGSWTHEAARARDLLRGGRRAPSRPSTRARWCRPRSWAGSTTRCSRRSRPAAFASSASASRVPARRKVAIALRCWAAARFRAGGRR